MSHSCNNHKGIYELCLEGLRGRGWQKPGAAAVSHGKKPQARWWALRDLPHRVPPHQKDHWWTCERHYVKHFKENCLQYHWNPVHRSQDVKSTATSSNLTTKQETFWKKLSQLRLSAKIYQGTTDMLLACPFAFLMPATIRHKRNFVSKVLRLQKHRNEKVLNVFEHNIIQWNRPHSMSIVF